MVVAKAKERVTNHKRVPARFPHHPPETPFFSVSSPIPPPKFHPTTMLRPDPILLLLLLLLPFSSPTFTPPDHHLLNCGSPDPATLHARLFLPDDAAPPRGSIPLSVPSSHHPLYSTARVFTRPSSYRFNLRSKGAHFLRLHFAPFTSPRFNSSAAAFSVSALGYTLLSNFTPPPDPLVKEFLLHPPGEGEKVARISFTPPSCMPASFAFVNAVELFSAPPALIWDIARIPSPGAARYVDGVSKQGFETVHRLNVGGAVLTPFNDTLWRTWDPDARPTATSSAAAATKVVSFTGRIQYRRGGSTREVAPDSVYRTAVELSSPTADSKMAWVLPVGLGHRYLVRLHLCDIVSLAVNQLYFNVYVNGGLAYEDLDLSGVEFSNQLLASPHYVDFVVEPVVVSATSGAISVSLGPSKLSAAGNMNAILNGLEVFKMNDSAGSFNAEASVGLGAGRMHGRKVSAWLCSVLGGVGFMSLLVGGVLMLSKRRVGFRDAFAWSPLPVDVEGNLKDGSSPLSGKLVCY